MPLPRVEFLVDDPGYAPGSPALQTGALTRSANRPSLAGAQGFEPRRAVSETAILPVR